MSKPSWNSGHVQIDPKVFADVKANEHGVVLGQGDDVWFHDLHLTPEQAMELADALTQGAAKCLEARSHA